VRFAADFKMVGNGGKGNAYIISGRSVAFFGRWLIMAEITFRLVKNKRTRREAAGPFFRDTLHGGGG
jgi:hypothetical protein